MNGIVVAIERLPVRVVIVRLYGSSWRVRCQRLAAHLLLLSALPQNLITLTHIRPLLIHFAPSAVPLEAIATSPAPRLCCASRATTASAFRAPSTRISCSDRRHPRLGLLLAACSLPTHYRDVHHHLLHRYDQRPSRPPSSLFSSTYASVRLCSLSASVALSSACRITSSPSSSLERAPSPRHPHRPPSPSHPAQLAERASYFLA
jgi:hypothetical protein